MSKKIEDVALIDLMPSSIKFDPDVIAACAGIQPTLDEVAHLVAFTELHSNIDALPESILQALAWENGLYGLEWSIANTIEKRRGLIKNAWLLNRLRGTPWSVKRVFSILGINAKIIEWFNDPGAQAGTFRVILLSDYDSMTSEQINLAIELVNRYKPLTRQLSSVGIDHVVSTQKTLNVHVAGRINYNIFEYPGV